ncbi:MAG TPA: hypothetical protein VJP45_01780, partial [Candidatus Limnocylindria bacterium]|nr:hypothetical protein [Candidatus Limnocylindria bacterium]
MTNERDDEILGRALSRAIETLEPPETPYARSRIGLPRARQGTSFWRVAALAASIVIAGALGSQLLLDRPAPDDSVGVQPTATVAPGATTAAASPTPRATESPRPTAIDHDRIFFSRVHDGLPPVSVHSDKARSNGSAADRI